MSSCRFDYLEDSRNGFTPDQIENLTNEHIRVAKVLYRHRWGNNNNKEQLFKFSNGKLLIPNGTQFIKQAQIVLNDLNKNGEIVKLLPNNSTSSYVSIDVRPLSSKNIDVDEESMSHFTRNFFGDSAIVYTEEALESQVNKEEHAEVWKKLSGDIKGKVAKYVNSLEKSGDKFGNSKDLKALLVALNDGNILESLSFYITNSGHNLGNLRARLKIIDEKIRNLSTNPNKRKKDLKEITDFVRHSSYYYHLFDILEDIDTDFLNIGIDEVAIDGYERDLLEDKLKEFLLSIHFSEEEILEILNETPQLLEQKNGGAGGLFNIIKQQYKQKLGAANLTMDKVDEMETDFQIILQDSLKKDGGLIQQLHNTLSTLKTFKSRLKELHYDTLTEIYYPVLEKAYNKGSAEYKEKYFLSKENFKALLSIGEEDINKITKWGSAMINVNEVVANTIANYFKDGMIDVNINNHSDISDIQKVITGKEQSKLDEIYNNSVAEAYILESIEEVDDTYIPTKNERVIEDNLFGISRKYKARKTKNILQQYDNLKFYNSKKIFQSLVQDEALRLSDILLEDKYGLINLKNSTDDTLRELYNYLYTVNKNTGQEFLRGRLGYMLQQPEEDLQNYIKNLLTSAFNKQHFGYFTSEEINKKFEIDGITKNEELIDLNNNPQIKKFVLRNSYSVDYKNENLESTFFYSPESLFAQSNGGAKKILVQLNNGQLSWIEIYNQNNEIQIEGVPNGLFITKFYKFNQKYQKLNEAKYNIEKGGFTNEARSKWNSIKSDSYSTTLFNKLTDKYKEAVDNMSSQSLRFNEVPQVEKIKSKLTKIKEIPSKIKKPEVKDFYDYLKTWTVDEKKFAKRDRDGNLVDDNGNLTDIPVYQTSEKQYINGQRVRDIEVKFTAPIDLDNIETDLYQSILMYKTSSNLYRFLKDNESQALLLQSVIEGDKTLGVDARKMKVKYDKRNITTGGGQIKYKEYDINTSELILSFINDYVYNITTEDYGILGTNISTKKLAGVVGKYTAFTSLAWNFMTMPSNAVISLHNTRAVAKGNEWYNGKDWGEALIEYKNALPLVMRDFGRKGLNIEKSALTQMIIRFNAIQGEFITPTGQLVNNSLGEKLAENSLFWTQEVVEHLNQSSSMIMLMKGYKLPSGTSLWDGIKNANINRKDGEELKMPLEFTRDLEIEFQKRLQAVNLVIHGNYSKLDKNMMQKGILTNMLMTFRKYIYDGFRSRFQSERPDIQTSTVQEGYFRTYLKQLNADLVSQVKVQGFSKELTPQILKAVGTSLLKSTLSGVDAAFGSQITKRNEKIKDFLHGSNLSERQKYAAIRSAYGIGNVIRLLIIISIVQGLKEGLDDDEEDMKKLLSYAELFSRKLESDIGFFESFTNFASGTPGFTTLDQFYKIVRDPFVSMRSIDNNVGIFKQLTAFDAINEEGEFELRWGAFDKYEKTGKGYQKGDYKITRKLQKSVISPYYQFIKFLDPEQQLSYQALIFKFSK